MWKGIGLEALVSCLRQKDKNKTTRRQQRDQVGQGHWGSHGDTTEGTKSAGRNSSSTCPCERQPHPPRGGGSHQEQQPWAPVLSLHPHQRPCPARSRSRGGWSGSGVLKREAGREQYSFEQHLDGAHFRIIH